MISVGSLALVLVAALVVEDHAPLRAAPRDGAPRQAVLWRGDWLEVRGERMGYVQVYDHRRERPGYVRPWQVRTFTVDEASAPALRAVIEFVRDSPGSESLGIGLVALYLKAAPASAVGPWVFDALGAMADRLARRATSTGNGPGETIAAHLEVAASYGVKLASVARSDDKIQICYDGEALRQVLALGGTPLERARAALGLTRPGCDDPAATATARQATAEWRRGVLEKVELAEVPRWLGNRVSLRRAAVEAELAHGFARRGDRDRSFAAGEAAVRALALVERTELTDEDQPIYEETAVRVGASRWAAERVPSEPAKRRLTVEARPGQPGETCLRVVEKGKGADVRCTFGQVWLSSLRVSPRDDAATIAVQPLAGWLELWVLHRSIGGEGTAGAWQVDTLTPGTSDPDVGYVENAGWSPDGQHLLVVREARLPAGGVRRDFQVLDAGTLSVEKQAHRADVLLGFRRWQSPLWKSSTLALR